MNRALPARNPQAHAGRGTVSGEVSSKVQPDTCSHGGKAKHHSRGLFSQPDLLIESADTLGTDAMRGLIDELLVPLIAERLVQDLVLSNKTDCEEEQ
jgi:hypothetical protein